MIQRGILEPLQMFASVARYGAFNRAAVELGVSTSALSHAIRSLEERTGVRLLNRTTRSVSLTEAGTKLYSRLDFALTEIDQGLSDLSRSRDTPSGTVRLTMVRHAYETVLKPIIPAIVRSFPDVRVEVLIEYGFSNITGEGIDAGIRFGEMVDRDMIAVPVGPDLRMAVVASPEYLARYHAPNVPADLRDHACINYRLMTSGRLYAWEFMSGGRTVEVKVGGALTFNEPEMMLDAALDGLGVAYVFEDQAASHVADGRLVPLLQDWTKPFSGYFIYYPSRRQLPPAFSTVLSSLKAAARS